mmetsp:Transcript_96114/g.220332  ORF Transcript_96114/g.220332 Transcript_96114/m.220332 type:complete len:95 (-) Transcript_96114:98-382(-)
MQLGLRAAWLLRSSPRPGWAGEALKDTAGEGWRIGADTGTATQPAEYAKPPQGPGRITLGGGVAAGAAMLPTLRGVLLRGGQDASGDLDPMKTP